jgi:Uma2 family endonuclease
MFRLEAGQIRIPDVAFIAKSRFAGRSVKPTAFWELGCDLAVEVISPSNTVREMRRKLDDYFSAGVRMVWYVYLEPREIVVYTSPQSSVTLRDDDVLDGGTVLPGFSVTVSDVYAELDATEA